MNLISTNILQQIAKWIHVSEYPQGVLDIRYRFQRNPV